MPAFHGFAELLEFDEGKYNATMLLYIEEVMRLAAVEFAKATLARIPVRTGFVSGTFGILEDLLGFRARLNPIARRLREYYRPSKGIKILKTPFSGRQFGTSPKDVFQREGTTLSFNFEVNITYYDISESRASRSPTSPWRSLVAGEAAFVEYVEETFNIKAPDPNDFLVIRTERF